MTPLLIRLAALLERVLNLYVPERHPHPVANQHQHISRLDTRRSPPRNAQRRHRLIHKQAMCPFVRRSQPSPPKCQTIFGQCYRAATSHRVTKASLCEFIRRLPPEPALGTCPAGFACATQFRGRGAAASPCSNDPTRKNDLNGDSVWVGFGRHTPANDK
jgi:hypothetical protein